MGQLRLDMSNGTWILFTHTNVPSWAPHAAWAVEYPNGWSRRSVMNKHGQAIYTRWVKPVTEVTSTV